jgi:hypothetical protein
LKALLRKVILALVAASMLAMSAAVLVVGAAFALYAVLQPRLGSPGAASVVAVSAAVLMALTAVALERWILRAPARKPGERDETLMARLIAMAQQRPIMATGAFIGAAAMAIRNPALISFGLKAFLDPKPRPPRKKA